ncbi:MAG TPA: hypothetical protein VGC86_01295 [Afipia sp.]
MKSAALTSAAVALVATLAVPFAAHAQGIIGGAQQGAYQGSAVAGPVGYVVGGAVGAGVGAGVGAVNGAVILSSAIVQGTAGAVGAIVGAPTTTVIEARPVHHRRHH